MHRVRHWAPMVVGLLASSVGSILLLNAGGWSPGNVHPWSFSHLVFLPGWGPRLLAIASFVGALCVWLAQRNNRPASWRDLERIQRTRRISAYWLVPIIGALFYHWRENTWHGDALLKLYLHEHHSLQTDPYVWKEPLDSLVAYTLNAYLKQFEIPSETGIALTSVVAGMIFVAAAIYLIRVLALDGYWAALFAAGLAGLGSSQLWFGHVENYSWVTAWTFVTVALATAYLRGQIRLWPVGLAAGVAGSFHPQAAFAAVGLAVLLTRSAWPKQTRTLIASGLIAPVLTIVLLRSLGVPFFDVTEGYAGDDQLFWRIDQALHPTVLAHALDNLLLVAPLFPLWLFATLWAIGLGGLQYDRVFRFYAALSGGLLVYHFSFKNELPRPIDWDLYAIVGPGITLCGLYACMMVIQNNKVRETARRVMSAALLPGLVFAVLFTGAWVGANHYHTLIRPTAAQRELYMRYQSLDLLERLPEASITPDTPICSEPVGCERVAATAFTMPHTGDVRPTLFAHAPAHVTYQLSVPESPVFLWASLALDPVSWQWGGDGVTFQVAVSTAVNPTANDQTIGALPHRQVLWSSHLSPNVQAHRDWHEVLISLADYRGETIELTLSTLPGPANDDVADRAGWGAPWIMAGMLDLRFE